MPRQDLPLGEVMAAVADRVRGLAPMHASRDPRELYSRVVTPELAPDFESLVNRAAFAVLAAAARARADEVDMTSGDAA